MCESLPDEASFKCLCPEDYTDATCSTHIASRVKHELSSSEEYDLPPESKEEDDALIESQEKSDMPVSTTAFDYYELLESSEKSGIPSESGDIPSKSREKHGIASGSGKMLSISNGCVIHAKTINYRV